MKSYKEFVAEGHLSADETADRIRKFNEPPEGSPYFRASVRKQNQSTHPGQSDNFKKWFGNSKMKDNTGKPIIFYHGTRNEKEFDEFEPRKGKNSWGFGSAEVQRHGFFFTMDKEIASVYSRDAVGNYGTIISVYLKMEHPLDLRNGFDNNIIEKYSNLGIDSTWLRQYNRSPEDIWQMFDDDAGEDFVFITKKLGYDGIIITEYNGDDEFDSYIVFSPEQIKSTRNSGEFKPTKNIHEDAQ